MHFYIEINRMQKVTIIQCCILYYMHSMISFCYISIEAYFFMLVQAKCRNCVELFPLSRKKCRLRLLSAQAKRSKVIFLLWLSDNTLCVYQNQYSVELLKGNNGILNGIFNKRREIPCCLPRQYAYISKAHDGKNKGSPHISQEFTSKQLLVGREYIIYVSQ